ncbi:aldo/keto reductase [Altererythrobacter salegens]|uniref:Aldo/keto reductase n=1 Tax=Croceibacterium salegens TaxID=1737568 RepID=A0A6I4SZU5_9SPHN|nr:aldo/keto reductase [Croceibacterium salegens]MXO60888.1 aldo/keto reductase [Croceibacterium salegens]
MPIDRRGLIAALAIAPIAASLPGCLRAAEAGPLVTRPLGAMGEVPLVGIGTARNYANPQTDAEWGELRATLARFAELGGKVIDTAPSYGRAEEVIGRLVEELGVRDKLFLATKVGADSLDQGKAQIEDSFAKLRTGYIDLIAVHNLRDVANELAYLRDLKAADRIGAIGVTTSFDPQYEDFEKVLASEAMDVIQVDYALDNRNAGERILPLAADRGIPALINLPFGRGRLFSATQGMELPGWAAEIGAASWAQVFLKYIVGHPARPIAIPGTDKVKYVDDNLGASHPPLPDEAMRRRMETFIDGL